MELLQKSVFSEKNVAIKYKNEKITPPPPHALNIHKKISNIKKLKCRKEVRHLSPDAYIGSVWSINSWCNKT